MTGKPDIVSEVVFLTQYNLASTSGVTVRCEQATARVFRDLIEDSAQPFDMMHFAGHGLVLADRPEEGGLLFGDELVHLTDLKNSLAAQQQLGFVYLSCCESGQLATDERTSSLLGLAHACIEAGVPAVLAMRWRITVEASLNLARAFYDALFEKRLLDLALCQAAQQVHDRERDPAKKIYAAAPVLIMH